MGIRRHVVHDALRQARRRGVHIPRFLPGPAPSSNGRMIAVSDSVMHALSGPAAKRGVSKARLAIMILEAVAADNLADAVLSDS